MDISDLFPAGPIIDEAHQIGRGPSIDALTDRLRTGNVVRVFDRRRWGKSSAARAALARLTAEGFVTVRLPLDEYPTASAAATFLASIFRTRGERATSGARSLGSRIGTTLSRAGQTLGSEEATLAGGLLEGLKPEEITLQRVLNALPDELANRNKRGAIAIDEAHVIAKWNRDELASLRAFLARDDRRTGIALTSSDNRAERKLRRSTVLGTSARNSRCRRSISTTGDTACALDSIKPAYQLTTRRSTCCSRNRGATPIARCCSPSTLPS